MPDIKLIFKKFIVDEGKEKGAVCLKVSIRTIHGRDPRKKVTDIKSTDGNKIKG